MVSGVQREEGSDRGADFARSSNNQLRIEDLRGGRRSIPVDPVEETLGCDCPDSSGILRDDGHWWIKQVGEQEVVETDDGNIMEVARPAKGPNRAYREEVLSGKDSGWRRGKP